MTGKGFDVCHILSLELFDHGHERWGDDIRFKLMVCHWAHIKLEAFRQWYADQHILSVKLISKWYAALHILSLKREAMVCGLAHIELEAFT